MNQATVFTAVVALSINGLVFPSPAHGEGDKEDENRSLDRPLINFNVGQVGIDKDLENPWRFGIEYRFSPVTRFRLVPSVGVAVGEEGANFIYTELRRDFRIADYWLLTPSFGVGRFNERDQLDLGLPLEFRSGLEISRQFSNGYRLGVAIFHLSNGSLAEENPGTEGLVLSFSVPLGNGGK